MTKQEKIEQLQARQLVLLSIMKNSDAHASKCIKLGKRFATEYPEEKAAYEAANAEYNENETRISNLEFEISVDQPVEELSNMPE